jgi:hypothetical protein
VIRLEKDIQDQQKALGLRRRVWGKVRNGGKGLQPEDPVWLLTVVTVY